MDASSLYSSVMGALFERDGVGELDDLRSDDLSILKHFKKIYYKYFTSGCVVTVDDYHTDYVCFQCKLKCSILSREMGANDCLLRCYICSIFLDVNLFPSSVEDMLSILIKEPFEADNTYQRLRALAIIRNRWGHLTGVFVPVRELKMLFRWIYPGFPLELV